MNRRGQVPRWRRSAAERLDQLLALPMLVLTLVFLVVMILPVVYPHLPPGARAALAAIDLAATRFPTDGTGGARLWLSAMSRLQVGSLPQGVIRVLFRGYAAGMSPITRGIAPDGTGMAPAAVSSRAR